MSVSIWPGCSEFTRTPDAASSLATDFVIPRTAHLLGAYAVRRGDPIRPATEDMLMIEPPPFATIVGAIVRMPRNTPTWFTSCNRRKSSSVVSASGAARKIPALLTSTSTRPRRSRAQRETASHAPSSVTSSAWASARSPTSPATSRTAPSSASVTSSSAPSSANRRAIAAPIPRPAPVINATFPSSRRMELLGGRVMVVQHQVVPVRESSLVIIPVTSACRDAVGGAAQRGDVELDHLEHRLHRAPGALRVRVREQLLHAPRHHLPGHAVPVFQPAALHFLPAFGQALPEIVDLLLVLAGDLEGDGFVEGELRAAVDPGEPLTV